MSDIIKVALPPLLKRRVFISRISIFFTFFCSNFKDMIKIVEYKFVQYEIFYIRDAAGPRLGVSGGNFL